MSQFDWGTMDPYVVDGVELADDLNQWRDALLSLHRGSSRPPYVVPGQLWLNDSAGPNAWVLQWYVSPTVGDVALFTLNTTTGAITISASTGGTFTAATLLAQAAANPMVRWNATGNPIDVKDWRMTVNGAGALVLSSYNDAGVLQNSITFNRNGTITAGPSAGVMTLYAETVLAAPAAAFQCAFPVGAKLVEVWFDVTLAVQNNINLKCTQNGGVPNAGNVYTYGYAVFYAVNSLQVGAVSAQPAIAVIGGAIRANGTFRITRPAAFNGVANWSGFDNTSAFYNYQHNILCNLTNCDGVQLTTAGTFAVGSYLRCLAIS